MTVRLQPNADGTATFRDDGEPFTAFCRADLKSQLSAARYVFHKVTVHKYALSVIRDGMPLDMARKHYDEAMRNYDGIVSLAGGGASQDMNMAEMAKGSDAVREAVEKSR